MKNLKIVTLVLLIGLLLSCNHKRDGDSSAPYCEETHQKTCVISDDSLITVEWWDTGEGGTAPYIEATCHFKTEKGDIKEETRPLLAIIHPSEYYSHRIVEKITSLDTPFGKRVYFFFLYTKNSSALFEQDLIALTIEGDSLTPANIMKYDSIHSSHIELSCGE